MIRILIEKEEVKSFPSKEWRLVANSGNVRDGGPVFDYVEAELPRTVTTKLLEQFVSDDLDVLSVIAAINGLEKKVSIAGAVRPRMERCSACSGLGRISNQSNGDVDESSPHCMQCAATGYVPYIG